MAVASCDVPHALRGRPPARFGRRPLGLCRLDDHLDRRRPEHDAARRAAAASGAELAAYSDGSGTLKVWSRTTGDRTVASGLPVGKPALVQLPSGAVELYAPATTPGFAEQGVLRWESTSGGASWSGPFATHSTSLADVQAAAVRPDGTPMFTQDGTFGVVVYQGLNGEVSHTVFGACCGYAESLAVDTSNYAQIAFWSNANAFPSQFVYEGRLDATGAKAGPGRAFGQPQTTPRDDDVPLVADGLGNTFMGWSGGYPSATSFAVNAFRGGDLVYSTVVAGGSFPGGDPHMALGVNPANRVWAVWTQGGTVHARRSRSAAHHFGTGLHRLARQCRGVPSSRRSPCRTAASPCTSTPAARSSGRFSCPA